MTAMDSPSATPSRRASHRSASTLGLTVKSGRASAVLPTRADGLLRVADSRTVLLSDPDVTDARQPYHAGFGTARAAGAGLSRLLTSVKRFGGRSMRDLLREYAAAGHQISGAGVVVGSLI